jgi:hypothetical protein
MAEIAGLGLPEDVLIMLEDMADNIESLTGET